MNGDSELLWPWMVTVLRSPDGEAGVGEGGGEAGGGEKKPDDGGEKKPDEGGGEKKPAEEGGEKKPAEEGGEKKPDEGAPEPLTAEALTMPEGVEIDEGLRDEFLGLVNNQELSAKDRANALIALQAKAMQAASEKSSKLWQETQEQWQEEVRKDPEIGGQKLDANLAKVRKLLDEYGSKELDDVFDLTGAGNNPHMVRFLVKVAEEFGEGGPISGRPANTEKTAAQILYPNQGS